MRVCGLSFFRISERCRIASRYVFDVLHPFVVKMDSSSELESVESVDESAVMEMDSQPDSSEDCRRACERVRIDSSVIVAMRDGQRFR